MSKGSTEQEKDKWRKSKVLKPSSNYLFTSKPIWFNEKAHRHEIAPIKGLSVKTGQLRRKATRNQNKLAVRKLRRAFKRELGRHLTQVEMQAHTKTTLKNTPKTD